MFMHGLQGEIGFHSAGGFGYSRRCEGSSCWMSVDAELSDTQRQRIKRSFRAWRRPGFLRKLRYMFGEPSIIDVKEGKDHALKLVFRDERNRLAIVRSLNAQLELAQFVADTLDWNAFRFEHTASEDPVEFTLQRNAASEPWHTAVVEPPPRPPRLRVAHPIR